MFYQDVFTKSTVNQSAANISILLHFFKRDFIEVVSYKSVYQSYGVCSVIKQALIDKRNQANASYNERYNHIIDGTIFIINVQYGLTMRLFRAEPLTFKAF